MIKRPFLTRFKNAFKFFDLFGHAVPLYIHCKDYVKSSFSGFASIVIMFLILYSFISALKIWAESGNVTTISSSLSYSIEDYLSGAHTEMFNLTNQNYYVYFALFAFPPNSPILDYVNLTRFFSQKVTYYSPEGTMNDLEIKRCTENEYNKFLNPDAPMSIDNSEITFTSCLKDYNILMGLEPQQQMKSLVPTTLTYQTIRCQNSTENNFSCAANEELDEILPYVAVQVTIPRSVYDFKNVQNPRKRLHDIFGYSLDSTLTKVIDTYITPVSVYGDKGYFSEDYYLKTTDFNIDYQQNDFIRDKNILFSQNIKFALKEQKYFQKNDSLLNIIANLGGTINILFLIGKIICSTYNLMILKHKLIKHSFLNLEEENVKSRKKDINEEDSGNFKFSLISWICGRFSSRKTYIQAIKFLYEYIGIEHIIEKMQDVDKLKLIIFDDEQRKLFNLLPKPGIGDTNSERVLTMKSLLEQKAIKNKKDSIKDIIKNLNSEDPINKRMISLLEAKYESEFKESIGKSSFSYFF